MKEKILALLAAQFSGVRKDGLNQLARFLALQATNNPDLKALVEFWAEDTKFCWDGMRKFRRLPNKFMLSSYPSEILTDYAQKQGWNMIELDLPRSAGGGRKVEVLTMNYRVDSVGLAA